MMLQQILTDMYIDPELLEELPEEQKHFLFFKMREEQVRRWMVREKEDSRIEIDVPSKHKNGTKNVEFMKGSDGNDWVWVMGEHENDKSIDQILEEEAEEKAIRMAELEIQKEMAQAREDAKRKKEEDMTMKQINQEKCRIIEEQTTTGDGDEAEFLKDEQKKKKIVSNDDVGERTVEIRSDHKMDEKENVHRDEVDAPNKENENKAEADDLPHENVDAKLRKKGDSGRKPSSAEPIAVEKEGEAEERDGVKIRRRSRGGNDDEERLRKLIMRRSREILFDFRSIRARFEETAKKDGKEIKRQWRAQNKKSKAVEEEIKQASLRVRQVHERSIRSPVNAMMAIELLQAEPSISQEDETDLQPIPRNLKSRPLPTPTSENEMTQQSMTSPKPPVPPRPRVTRRPANQKAAINWFQKHQKPRAAVIDPVNRCVVSWFQGIISRSAAETVLEECSPGTFLLRISERLFGYAVSVRGEHRCKHFLIEAMPQGGYRLFGLGQHRIHSSLHHFIGFHKVNPLSVLGHEYLVEPVPPTSMMKMEEIDSESSTTKTELFPEIPIEDVVTSF